MVCDGCDNSWHIGCVPHEKKGARCTVPLTGAWLCPECAQPCETCDEKDVFDDPQKRMLCCDKCDKSVHMHCLNTPLKKEPVGSWRCAECGSRRMVTRLMAEKKICAGCHEDVRQGSTGCQECSFCRKLWHAKRPCLQPFQFPTKDKKGFLRHYMSISVSLMKNMERILSQLSLHIHCLMNLGLQRK